MEQPTESASPAPTARPDPDFSRGMYEAYSAHAGGKTWDGRDIPTWAQLVAMGSPVVGHWDAARDHLLAQLRVVES